jgi:mannose-6-phosphate isomerase-like protein (cupin superfamily)
MRARRVVTGHDDTGKAVVVSDEVVEPADPDFAPKWSIWAADAPVGLPDGGLKPSFAGPLVPLPGGVHVIVLTFPAGYNTDMMFDTSDPVSAAAAAREQMEAAVAVVPDPNPPGCHGTLPGFTGMHATASVDCMLQLSGASVLVLDDTEVRLDPGDWVVVNGVTHSWRNDGDEPAVLVAVVVGAHHTGAPLRTAVSS